MFLNVPTEVLISASTHFSVPEWKDNTQSFDLLLECVVLCQTKFRDIVIKDNVQVPILL